MVERCGHSYKSSHGVNVGGGKALRPKNPKQSRSSRYGLARYNFI